MSYSLKNIIVDVLSKTKPIKRVANENPKTYLLNNTLPLLIFSFAVLLMVSSILIVNQNHQLADVISRFIYYILLIIVVIRVSRAFYDIAARKK